MAKTSLRIAALAAMFHVLAHPAPAQTPLGAAFTYQGRLNQSGQPYNGSANLIFKLYDASVGGNLLGSQTLNGVGLADGLFTVVLNGSDEFGASAFDGDRRWLDITVNGTPLSPRQELTAAPYALFAQSVPVPLTLSGTSTTHIIRGENASAFPGAVAISGQSTAANGQTFGVLGQSQSTVGSGVVGVVSSGTGVNFGVSGRSDSTSGRGVYGQTRAGTGDTYGVYGESTSDSGRGVLGWATAASGVTYGVSARSDSSSGRGVFAYAAASSGITYGVYAQSESVSGTGVFGTGTTGVYGSGSTGVHGEGFDGVTGDAFGSGGHGVLGIASGTNGTGVYGAGTATSGSNYGVYGLSYSPLGRAVYGHAAGGGDAVFGQTGGTSGRGAVGYATAGSGSTYGMWGQSDSLAGVGVYGLAAAGSGTTYGVVGQTNSPVGQAVVGHSTATTGPGNGVIGWCDSPSGFDFNAIGAGINYGSTSSKRWKTDVVPIGDPLDKLARLRGVYFTWDAKHGGRHDLGMIAEEVGAVLPEIVGYEENGIDAIGMDYSKMTPLLVQAVNALRAEKDTQLDALRAEKDAQITEQQERINALTARLEQLEKVMSQTGTD